MFVKNGLQYAEDTVHGLSLEVTGPSSFIYRDNGRTLEIAAEPIKRGDAPYAVCLYLSDAEFWDGDDGQLLTEAERGGIAANLAAALRAMELEAEIA